MFALHSSSFRRELLVEKQTGLFSSITFWPNYSNNSRESASREQPVENWGDGTGRISAAMSQLLFQDKPKRGAW
jgi:hypothetical protein